MAGVTACVTEDRVVEIIHEEALAIVMEAMPALLATATSLGEIVGEVLDSSQRPRGLYEHMQADIDTGAWSFDTSAWLPARASDDELPQFPREQWASYPTKRMVTLLICDRMLDLADELTDEQWMTLCILMQYGGKTRIA